jgi:hypothetical protein
LAGILLRRLVSRDRSPDPLERFDVHKNKRRTYRQASQEWRLTDGTRQAGLDASNRER